MPTITADRFWDLYFRGAFLKLTRGGGVFQGTAYAQPDLAQPPGGILREPVLELVDVSDGVLRDYHYAGDQRFSYIEACRMNIGAAYDAVIRQTYPYRDAAPFGKSRMAELFVQTLEMLGGREHPLSLATLESTVLRLLDRHTAVLNQPLAALAWFLGERRERSSSEALMAIVSNAPFAPFSVHSIHFTAIDAALSALCKVNDKAKLLEFAELMKLMDETGRRKIAPLFERLLSITELLSLARCEEDYFRPEFWQQRLQPWIAAGPADWDRFDAESLFWEIRYLAALRLSPEDKNLLYELAGDVVGTVASAARARLENPLV